MTEFRVLRQTIACSFVLVLPAYLYLFIYLFHVISFSHDCDVSLGGFSFDHRNWRKENFTCEDACIFGKRIREWETWEGEDNLSGSETYCNRAVDYVEYYRGLIIYWTLSLVNRGKTMFSTVWRTDLIRFSRDRCGEKYRSFCVTGRKEEQFRPDKWGVCTRGHGKMVSVVGWLDKGEVSLYLLPDLFLSRWRTA